MLTTGFILGAAITAVQIISMLFLFRAMDLYEYRIDLLTTAFAFNDRGWRIKEVKKQSFFKMLFMFWKKFDNFYPQKSFLN